LERILGRDMTAAGPHSRDLSQLAIYSTQLYTRLPPVTNGRRTTEKEGAKTDVRREVLSSQQAEIEDIEDSPVV
jgi:hypothetical protein